MILTWAFHDLTERGVERHVELEGLSAEQVEQKVTDLLTKPPS